MNKIRRVENTADRCKNKESWAVINEITGRKAKGETQIRGNGPGERKRNWLEHFKALLGSSPVVQDEEVEIEQQFEERDISTEPFSLEELRTAKKKITEGKQPGMTEFNLKS